MITIFNAHHPKGARPSMAKVTKQFQTEVKQLLDLVIHSLYSNRDIFLRELVSNASDAVDKARFESHANESLVEGDSDWKIRLTADKEAGTLTISDNGIGMAIEEVEENIGTIARSGTKLFVEAMQQAKDTERPDLIGQFGVGFYSAFMVADRVVLTSRKGGFGPDAGCRWESTGDGSYTLEECRKEKRGTDVTLHLKEEHREYLDEWKIRQIIRTYSDYIQYPVVMDITREEAVKDADGKVIEGGGTITRTEEQTLNSMKAIWTRPKSEITEEEYTEFYHHVSHDFDKPLKTIHYAAEGTSEFRALLYIPSKKPFDLFHPDKRRGVQLYVRRVFISDKCEHLLPDYLRFVKGVVDSSDLPLNVSREILQEDVQIRRIEKSLTAKILSTLAEMKEKENDDYLTFYREFGPVLKEGVHFDHANKEKLADLLLFESSATEPGSFVSLKDYCGRMPEGQKEIYYLTGMSRAAVENSPHIELVRSKGYEVLYLVDPVDEWVVQALREYDGKKLSAADRGDLELEGEEEKKAREEQKQKATEELGGLLGLIKEKLGERVADVRLSSRLTESACCLVSDQHGLSANMERILKAMNQEMPESKRILELNPTHPLMEAMNSLYEKDKEAPQLGDYSELLLDQALLTEGSTIKDPLRFSRLLSDLMVRAASK
jgi:molecular chaperone HtpG